MLHMLHRLKPRRIISPLQIWHNFSVSAARRRAPGPTRPRTLDPQQSEAVASALRHRQAQLGAAEPFFYVHRSVRRQWPSLLQSLNTSFRKAHEDPSSVMWQSQLWADYRIAKERVPDLLASFNDKAWDTLWSTQSIKSHSNTEPQSRQQALLEDMKTVGIRLTFAQRLAHLEGLFLKGEAKEALEQWEAGYNMTGELREGGHKPEFLELGARIHLAMGNTERAEKVLMELFDMHPTWRTQMALELIHSCVEKNAPNLDRSFETYQRLARFLGSKFSLQDYDGLILAFLKARAPLRAGMILKDMMSNGLLAREDTDKDAMETMKRIKAIMSSCASDQEINEIGLMALSAVRSSYCDLLFVEWLVVLRARNSADSALKVLELMYERGVKPRSQHFNLMLTSLFSARNPDAVRQAEEIAWKMINERVSATSTGQMANKEQHVPFFLKRQIPWATAATFAELLSHYAEARRWDALHETKRVLEQHQWPSGSAAFLNAVLHADLLAGNYALIWERFRAWNCARDLESRALLDGGTYWRLWLCLRRCSYDAETPVEGAPTPRHLMAHMANWAGASSETKLLRSGGGHMSSVVSACFMLNKDLPGQLVAMHTLHHFFRIAPSPKTAHAIYKQLCLVDLPAATREQRSRINRSGIFSKRMARIVRVHEMLGQRRVDDAVAEGEARVEQLRKNNDEFLLNTLSELIRVVLVRQFSPEQVERMIEDAKREMGVPDISTGDVDAFRVH